MNPDGEAAGRAEAGMVWKYNGKLEISTRRSIKNSLENMRVRVENEVSSRGDKGQGRKGWLQEAQKKVNKNVDVGLLSAAQHRALASGDLLFASRGSFSQ